MDKQTMNIPVNTRTVGNAKNIFEGIYVLYLEDYVHTFIKKLLYEHEFDNALEAFICMYGSSFEKESQNIMVVSGAVTLDEADKDYFAKETRLCKAAVTLNKDRGIRFEISMNGAKVILDDFYIYYDQNEEMQNYLIEWNEKRHERQMEKMPVRAQNDNAAKLGRLALGYNRESARVSLVWGAMNVLSLSLAACVIAYGIISFNSYAKMKSMQKSIDYCMAFVSENMEKFEKAAEKVQPEPPKAEAVKEAESVKEETLIQAEQAEQIPQPGLTSQQEMPESLPQQEEIPKTEPIIQPEAVLPSGPQIIQSINTQAAQYYVVQKGDTLGQICITMYGDYSRMGEICGLNGIENPDNIFYGQKLLLP